MGMVPVRLVCPTGGARVIHDTGDEVAVGDVVEVPATLAGHPPVGTPEEDGYDPGAGLLAQAEVWAPAGDELPGVVDHLDGEPGPGQQLGPDDLEPVKRRRTRKPAAGSDAAGITTEEHA